MASTPEARQASIAIRVETAGWRDVPGLRRQARAAVGAACAAAHEGGGGAEVSVLFTGDAAMQALNLRYRGKDKATNVLSFPSDPPLLGDIVLAFETVAAEARAQDKPLGEHVCHLLVHGALHLMGHDHETPGERARMEALEIRILAQLGIADPYVARSAAQ